MVGRPQPHTFKAILLTIQHKKNQKSPRKTNKKKKGKSKTKAKPTKIPTGGRTVNVAGADEPVLKIRNYERYFVYTPEQAEQNPNVLQVVRFVGPNLLEWLYYQCIEEVTVNGRSFTPIIPCLPKDFNLNTVNNIEDNAILADPVSLMVCRTLVDAVSERLVHILATTDNKEDDGTNRRNHVKKWTKSHFFGPTENYIALQSSDAYKALVAEAERLREEYRAARDQDDLPEEPPLAPDAFQEFRAAYLVDKTNMKTVLASQGDKVDAMAKDIIQIQKTQAEHDARIRKNTMMIYFMFVCFAAFVWYQVQINNEMKKWTRSSVGTMVYQSIWGKNEAVDGGLVNQIGNLLLLIHQTFCNFDSMVNQMASEFLLWAAPIVNQVDDSLRSVGSNSCQTASYYGWVVFSWLPDSMQVMVIDAWDSMLHSKFLEWIVYLWPIVWASILWLTSLLLVCAFLLMYGVVLYQKATSIFDDNE